MEQADKKNIQTLHCKKCNGWLKLKFKYLNKNIEGVQIHVPDMPGLVCQTCNTIFLPTYSKKFIREIIQSARERGANKVESRKKENLSRYEICQDMNFSYDVMDCKCIPGLEGRLSKQGFFTPVFFNREVLHKYISFDEYKIAIHGNTYGTIFFPQGTSLDFGINPNKKMFCWLGDIEDNVSRKEQYYLISENIESDHDVASEFYAAQIEAEFSSPSDEQLLLQARNNFDQSWSDRYSSNIFEYKNDIFDLVDNLLRPVNWNEEAVRSVILSLTGMCIEVLKKKSIIDAIYEDPHLDPDVGTLKLMETLIEKRYDQFNAKNIMQPFFVLYDFRLVLSHTYPEQTKRKLLDDCFRRLAIPEHEQNFEKLYLYLLKYLKESYSKLTNLLSNN